MIKPNRRGSDYCVAAAMRIILCNQPQGMVQGQPVQQRAGNEVGSRRQHQADQRHSLRVKQHAMTGIADTNGEDHLSEKSVANYEVDRPDGGALCVINNWNRDVEDRIVGQR